MFSSKLLVWLPILSLAFLALPLGEIGIAGVNMFPHILILITLSFFLSKKKTLMFPSQSLYSAVIFFGVILLLSVFQSWYHGNLSLAFIWALAYLFGPFCFLIVYTNLNYLDAKRYLNWFFIFLMAMCVATITTGYNTGIVRSSALQFNRNDIAMMLSQGLIIFGSAFLLKQPLPLKRIIIFLFPLVGLVTLVNSGNRGAIGGLAFGFVLASLIFFRYIPKTRLLSLGALGILLLSILFFMEHRIFASTIDRGEYHDIGRVGIGIVALEIFRENWLFGVGIGNYWTAYLEQVKVSSGLLNWLPGHLYENIYGQARPPHNLYLRLGVEIGIIGIISFLSLILALLRKFRSNYLISRDWYSFSGFVYVISASGHSFFYEGYIYPYHYLFLAVLLVLSEQKSRAHNVRSGNG